MALKLQSGGCHNVNFVSPTHHAPQLVEAVRLARDRGLEVPVVWNCGGYESTEVLALLDGVVDVYRRSRPSASELDPEGEGRTLR